MAQDLAYGEQEIRNERCTAFNYSEENTRLEPPALLSESIGELSSDIANLIGDNSFNSETNSDESGNWIQKIDVSSFKQLIGQNQESRETNISIPPQTLLPQQVRTEGRVNEELRGGFDYGESGTQSYQTALSLNVGSHVLSSQCALPTPPYSGESGSAKSEVISPPAKRVRNTDTCSEAVQSSEPSPSLETSSQLVSSSTDRRFPKPTYSYSCLIALSLRNSPSGKLQVSEIYNFMCENFPYFRTAPPGWKNSVRHNLSLNKCFEKVEIESPAGHGRKACLWMLNPNRRAKMEQEIIKWREKDPSGVRDALANADELDAIEKGLKGMPGDMSGFVPMLPDILQQTQKALLLSRSMPGFSGNCWYPDPARIAPEGLSYQHSMHPSYSQNLDPFMQRPPVVSGMPYTSEALMSPMKGMGQSQNLLRLSFSQGSQSQYSPVPERTPPYSPVMSQSSPHHQRECSQRSPSLSRLSPFPAGTQGALLSKQTPERLGTPGSALAPATTCMMGSPYKYGIVDSMGTCAQLMRPMYPQHSESTLVRSNNNPLLQAHLAQSPSKPTFTCL